MSKISIPNLIEPGLTPSTAGEKGYRFVQDVIDPYQAVKEIIELAEKKGYTFGTSLSKKGKVGLYKREK
jgi:hypothetical protein